METYMIKAVYGNSKEEILANGQAEAEKVFGAGATAALSQSPYLNDNDKRRGDPPQIYDSLTGSPKGAYYGYVRMEEGEPPTETAFTRSELTAALRDLGWVNGEASADEWIGKINFKRSFGRTTRDHGPQVMGQYTYTRTELEDAMYPSYQRGNMTLVKIIEKIEDNRRGSTAVPGDTVTLTASKLRKAIVKLTGWKFGDGEMVAISAPSPSELVVDLIDAAKDEPEYPVGSTWRDADGKFWQRYSGNRWHKFGTATKFFDEAPNRPLERVDK